MEIWRRAGLPVVLVAIALALATVEGDTPLDLSIPADPEAGDLSEKVVSLEENVKAPFSAIPNILMTHGAKEIQAESRQECQEFCAADSLCHSVSFNAGTRRCLNAPGQLDYSSGWKLHIKQVKMNAIGMMKPTGEYDAFSSVKFKDGQFQDSSSDLRTCQGRCDAEENCGSFSYNARKMNCYLSGDGVVYDPSFTYYEKTLPDAGPPTAEARPTQIATASEEEELEQPRFIPPDDSLLNAKLERTAARVEEVEHELSSPVIKDLDSRKELSSKQGILVRERLNARNSKKVRLQKEEIHQVQVETASVDFMIKREKERGPEQLKAIAEAAFQTGFKAEAKLGKAEFDREKAEIMSEGQRAANAYTGADPNSGMLQIKAAQKEKYQKRQSMHAVKARERTKEISEKRMQHEEALALSRQGAALISAEASSKMTARVQKERALKSVHQQQDKKLSTAAEERGAKKVGILLSGEKQSKSMEHFRLTQARDEKVATETDVQSYKEIEVKKQSPDPQVARAKRIEEVSGVKERSSKDQMTQQESNAKRLKVAQYEEDLKLKNALAELTKEKAGKKQEAAKDKMLPRRVKGHRRRTL